jgi:hypothetical protein
MRPWLALCTALLLAAAPLLAQAQPNLLANSGFEDLGADGKLAAWSFAGQGELVTAATGAHGGRHYVRVRFEDCAIQTVPVEPNAYYFVEGFVRSEKPETDEVPRLKVYFANATGKTSLISGGFITRDSYRDWQPFRVTLRAPQDGVSVAVRLIGEYNGSDWFHFDEVTMRKVPLREWPAAAELPALNGQTVVVPDLADVWSFALYRVPPQAQAPLDGLLSTQAWTNRAQEIVSRPPNCDFDIRFGKPVTASWLLVHAVSPDERLGRAAVFTLPADRHDEGRKLLDVPASDRVIHALRFKPEIMSGVRLRVYGTDKRAALLQEIQAFGTRPGLVEKGPALSFGPGALTAAEQAALQEAYAGEADRQVLLGAAGAVAAAAPVTVAGGHPLNLLAEAGGGQACGVKSLTLRAQPQGLKPGAVLEVCLKKPAELDLNISQAELADRREAQAKDLRARNYADVCRLLVPVGADGVALTLDVPDFLLPAGERLWLTLRSENGFTLSPGNLRMSVETCPPAQAVAEYAPQFERLVRRLYSRETEAHPYDGLPCQDMILYRLTERMLELDPRNQPALLIQRRLARRWWPVQVTVEGPAAAPEWARLGRHCAREWKRVADWWLANRWVPNGELGADLNDDCEYTCHWPLAYLVTGDDRYRQAQRALADAVWEQSGGSGYAIRATDVEHAAEDASCTLPQMLLCEYGNPVHVERMMKMSEHIPFWTGINDQGRRHFRSYVFSTKMIKDQPKDDIDHLYCALAMCGATHLAWYCRNPQPLGWVHEYQQAWCAVAMSTEKGKPVGALPCDVHFKTGQIAPYTEKWNQSVYYAYGDYVTKNFLWGAQELTRDPALQPAVDLQLPPVAQAVAQADVALKRYAETPAGDPAQPASLDKSWPGAINELTMWRAFQATGKREYLVSCLRAVAEDFERTRWLVTEAEPITDRVPVPGTTLLRYMFLGGDCAGKTHVPRLGVSWEGGGTDFAALVLKSDYDALKVLVYNFRDKPLPLTMRVWKLDHGEYTLTAGVDANQDDVADKPTNQKMVLGRYSGVPLTLAPGQVTVIEARQLNKLEPLAGRADLAISDQDVEILSPREVRVTVHNIGAAAAENISVCMLDKAGKVVDRQTIARLAAPADLKPQTATVTLKLVPEGQVLVSPNVFGSEIYEGNNRVAVKPPRGRFVHLR